MPETILIHAADLQAAALLQRAFEEASANRSTVQTVEREAELLNAVQPREIGQLVILDAGVDIETELAMIPKIRRIDANVPIVFVADRGSVESVARAIDEGATDFLVRGEQLPERISTLLGKLKGYFDVLEKNRLLDAQNISLKRQAQARVTITGSSRKIKNLIHKIQRVGQVPRPVLILGERGTGKELVARAIHAAGENDESSLITINCAAFTDTLLESEIFGHEKGSFTGADSTRPGRFEQSDGGTLFLDEIGNMPLAFQQKILRVVEYGTYTRVGGNEELKTTARIVAATNCDLRKKIKDGAFLEDLYDRLSFEVLNVPPLRERKGDIEVLAKHFLKQFANEIPAFRGKVLSAAAIDMLNEYHFPGNVRELKNIIERAAYRDTTNEITPEDIGMLASEEITEGHGTFKEKVDAFSSRLILDAMAKARGNQAKAARLLGLSYHQFRYHHGKLIVKGEGAN